MLKLVFMGSDAIALPTLHWLAGDGKNIARLVGVFTQPDKAVGRGQKIQANEIKLWAEARGLPVFQPLKIGDAEHAQLRALQPDLVLVMAYGHILKQVIIDTPVFGTLNLHTSILPKYRGASPIQTAIACGETETGVTLMRMVLKLDAGPVAGVERVAIAPLDTAREVETKLAAASVSLLARCLPRIALGEQIFSEQDARAVTFCRRHEKGDGALDFQAPASQLAGRINGLMPWPGCSVTILGQLVKIGLADVLPVALTENYPSPTATVPSAPGMVMGEDAAGLLVGTGQGTLRLRMLQRPGGKMLPAKEFLRGCPVAAGTLLPSQPMPPLVAREPFAWRKA